jgi:hypothetical protein
MTRILALLLAFSCLSAAREQAVHWADLSGLITGKQVAVRLVDGKRVKGRAVRVTLDSVMVDTSVGQTSIGRSSLQEIRVGRTAGYKGRVLGTAIGVGAGVAVSVPLLRYANNEGSSTFRGVAIGLLIATTVLGYLTGWSVDRSTDLIRILPD